MKLFILLVLPLLLFATKAMVSLEIPKNQDFFVSKKFIAKLKVATTAFSISDLDVDFKTNNEVVIIAPQSASYINSQEINGEMYQYSLYEYEMYPLKANGISIKPFEVRFNVSLGYGQPKEYFELNTTQKELFIYAPKEIDGFILATSSLHVKSHFSSSQQKYKVGDAITQSIEISAKDTLDVLLPSIKFKTIEGLKLYENESKLVMKGSSATRIQSVTYLLERDKNTTIPSYSIIWYDIKNKMIKHSTTPTYSFEVIGEGIEQTLKPKKKGTIRILHVMLVLLSITVVVLLLLYWKQHRDKNRYALIKRINPK